MHYSCAMTHRIRWNDLQIVLAVAQHGSASRAAGMLGINHSTVIRRINDFEASHNVKLFERHPTGLKPTRAGRALLEASQPIEGAVLNIEREILGQDLKLEGLIRLTTTESIADRMLVPHLKTFRETHPAISIDLIITSMRLDLPRLDADISIRPSRNPPDDLIGRNVSRMSFTTYAQIEAHEHWQQLPREEIPWVGISHALENSPVADWMKRQKVESQIATRANSFVTTCEMIANGLGVGVLPCFLGDCDSRMIRLVPPSKELDTNVWVLAHKDLRNSARVRALSEHLARGLRRQRDLLEGRTYKGPTAVNQRNSGQPKRQKTGASDGTRTRGLRRDRPAL
jgi:DNA-binding transcriptional LysR family regulator